MEISVKEHYDLLICEGNDPVYDPMPLREHMDKWDGETFFNELKLDNNSRVLEIGVGTGRLALKTAPVCGSFVGVDISEKTIEKARQNLSLYPNASFICADFFDCDFLQKFDVIYSSLTFMHIEKKQLAVSMISELLSDGGRFVLSIDKNRSDFIDMGSRKIRIFPDTPNKICEYINCTDMRVQNVSETEFAYIITAVK